MEFLRKFFREAELNARFIFKLIVKGSDAAFDFNLSGIDFTSEENGSNAPGGADAKAKNDQVMSAGRSGAIERKSAPGRATDADDVEEENSSEVPGTQVSAAKKIGLQLAKQTARQVEAILKHAAELQVARRLRRNAAQHLYSRLLQLIAFMEKEPKAGLPEEMEIWAIILNAVEDAALAVRELAASIDRLPEEDKFEKVRALAASYLAMAESAVSKMCSEKIAAGV